MAKLYLVTKTFPIGNGERAFLQYEAELLKKTFDLTIVVTELDDDGSENKKDDGHVITILKNATFFRKIISAIAFVCKEEAWEEFFRIIREGKMVRKRLGRALMFGTAAETFWIRLKNACNICKDTNAVFYFYWWDYKCLGVTIHKKKYPHMRVVTRTHGYDLYDERELYGKQFFKKQMERNLEKIFFISEYGKTYYEKKGGCNNEQKYVLSRLGVVEQVLDVDRTEEGFLLVSCSNVIPLKRLELIVEGLSLVSDISIRWVHFGDGEKMEEIKEMAEALLGAKDNVSYTFAGRVDNPIVMDYYRDNPVSCFITTTSTEGNPVSVQEALSFGIPVIATAISDIPLMIDGNGVLLSEDPEPREIADAIHTIASVSETERLEMKKKSYEIWSRDYNAEKNYTRFVELLSKV